MPDYRFVDGPLVGQTISSDDMTPGETLVVEVVDFDQDPENVPRFTYVMEGAPAPDVVDHLRFSDTFSGQAGAA